MRRLVFCLFVALSVGATTSAIAADSYEQMVARVRAGDETVDLRALRYAYAESPQYAPYKSSDGESELIDGVEAKDCKKILAATDKILKVEYVDIRAHMWRASCFEETKDEKKATFHRRISTGLIKSIMSTGDGLSTKTAWVVIAVDEEYEVLAALGVKISSQSLVSDGGHSFDLMNGTTEDNKALAFYFQIDRPLAELGKSLGDGN